MNRNVAGREDPLAIARTMGSSRRVSSIVVNNVARFFTFIAYGASFDASG